MPGLAGRVGSRPAGADGTARRLLARMASAADHVTSVADGAVDLAHAALPVEVDQGAVRRDGDLTCVVHGWVAHGACAGGHASHCMEAYRSGGEEALATLNGVYAVALWDGATEQLTLAHDRLGCAPLHYRVDSDGIQFASRPRALVDDGAQIDARALGQLLATGYPMEDRTLFRGVFALGPGRIATWKRGRFGVRRVVDPIDWKPAGWTEAQAIEALHEALAAAVGDRLGDVPDDVRLVLPLSGGLDSRTVLGYARGVRRATTYSYGHGHSWDQKFGARLAKVAGTRHRQIRLQRDYMATLGPRLVFALEGQASLHAAHILVLTPELARRPSLALSGFLGDALTGGHLGWLDESAGEGDVAVERDAARLFARMVRVGFDDDELKRLLKPALYEEARGAAWEAFAEIHRRGATPQERADAVDLELRQHRFTSYQLDALGSAAVMRAPFADPRVIDACRRLTLEQRREQRVYKQLLRQHHADLAEVPVAATGVPLHGSWARVELRRQLERLRWRLLPRWTGGLWRPHDYRQYAHYDEWIRTGARSFFCSLLDNDEVLSEVFQVEAVAELLKRQLDGAPSFQKLSAVATVALWLRFFRDPERVQRERRTEELLSARPRPGVAAG